MAYTATMIPIMLASPGDVLEERSITRDAMHEWNYIHSLSTQTALMPVGWETHSAPDLGGRAQELINDRVLADCDLLVGIFWTRLGTPTGDSASGTVEEIQKHLDAGKPAMVYFSSAPVAPESLDPTQYAALSEFRDWCKAKGIIETYSNYSDFRDKFVRQLQIQLRKNPYLVELLSTQTSTDAKGVESAAIPPPAQAPESLMSAEAKELLLEATAGNDGMIMRLATLGGRYVQANGKSFGDPRDRRSNARWEYAIEELVDQGFLIARGVKGEVFEVTARGYDTADRLRAAV